MHYSCQILVTTQAYQETVPVVGGGGGEGRGPEKSNS